MHLIENPFYLLKASPKDNRKKLLELADEAAFDMDSIKANESRSILSNPRKRLEAEISFFPGCTNIQNKKIFNILKTKNNFVYYHFIGKFIVSSNTISFSYLTFV